MAPIERVVLIGADGTLGPAMLQGLLTNSFNVTVVKRVSSKSSDDYPSGVSISKVNDDMSVDELTKAFANQDAVVATIKGSQVDVQKRIAQACIAAGVQRFIPADFGSCDSNSRHAQQLVPLFKRKTEVRAYLSDLTEAHPAFSWTALVCGHFADCTEFLHIYPKTRTMDVLDDGNTRFSLSSLSRVAEATARILKHLDRTKNRVLFIQSLLITQMELVAALERATGAKWSLERKQSREYEKEQKAKADDGDLEAVEDLVWLLGTLEGDWTKRDDFAMELLGLEDEKIDDVVQKVLKG